MNVLDSEFKSLLQKYKKITVVGMSPNASRPSHQIPLYLKANGYEVVGVNPGHEEINGIKIYKTLMDVPADFRKFVDVFRAPEAIPSVVDEVLAAGGVEVLWLQLGISHLQAETLAEKSGLKVISNRCILIEHKKYF